MDCMVNVVTLKGHVAGAFDFAEELFPYEDKYRATLLDRCPPFKWNVDKFFARTPSRTALFNALRPGRDIADRIVAFAFKDGRKEHDTEQDGE